MGIVRFALRFPYTFYVLAALIVFLGVSAITVMSEDIFPEINIPVVTVIWQYTGLSTPEMEQRVTTYSQYATSTAVSGIRNTEAQTLNGISVIKIFFQPDVNIDLAISQIISATNYIRVLMPAGIQAAMKWMPFYYELFCPIAIFLERLARFGFRVEADQLMSAAHHA